MSRFFSSKFKNLEPYTPGEQPQNVQYIKLNTNESPFPPSAKAVQAASEQAKILQLYSDPDCGMLKDAFAKAFGLNRNEIIFVNGSDEILDFAFAAFCDDTHPAAFPDISYGFYPVYAQKYNIPYTEIPLKDDFTINVDDYCGIGKTIFIANPNAPTGIALSSSEIERIISTNRDNVVLVDEAYVDFGAESCIPLIRKYDNLIVTQTFSKSRSLAGGRLGFGAACPDLISDLNSLRFSTNPYNINRMTMAAGVAAVLDREYTESNCRTIAENRAYTTESLRGLGFSVLDSKANFIFAKHPELDGKEFYLTLKRNGILIRHFDKQRLCQYNRITIGTREQMDIFLDTVRGILGGTVK